MQNNEVTQIRDILSPEVETEAVEEQSVVEDEVIEEVEATEEVAETEETETSDEPETEPVEGDTKSYTVASLAEAIGWEAEDIYKDVSIQMKDGENVTLGEFKDKFQDVSHENVQLKEKLTAAESGVTQTQQLSNEMTTLRGQLSQIDSVEQNTNWAELEELDPTDAILKRDKINRARLEVQGQMNELQGKEAEMYNQYMSQQRVKTLELIPAWKDEKVLNTEQNDIMQTMRDYGFTDAESRNMEDPRQMQIMNDFTKLLSKSKVAQKALKKVRSAPQVIGSNRAPVAAKPEEAVTKLVNKAKKSGDKKDVHNAIKNILAS